MEKVMLQMELGGHEEHLDAYLTTLKDTTLMLGYPGLCKHDPAIDWEKKEVSVRAMLQPLLSQQPYSLLTLRRAKWGDASDPLLIPLQLQQGEFLSLNAYSYLEHKGRGKAHLQQGEFLRGQKRHEEPSQIPCCKDFHPVCTVDPRILA